MGSAVAVAASALPGYERLTGAAVPVSYATGSEGRAREVLGLLERGALVLSDLFETEPPEVGALLVSDGDWEGAPREGVRVYPAGLPYFTRSVRPPVVVLPEELSAVFWPRTEATYPLAVWHELAHAFLLRREVVRTPVWLGELVPQAASAAVARRAGLPLDGHLREIDRKKPGFAVRTLGERANAGEQMAFQNLLLLLGVAALEEFGEGFLGRLAHALWAEEKEPVGEEQAEKLFADALGTGGGGWLASRPEF